MRSPLLILSLMAFLSASLGFARVEPVSGFGEAHYVRWNMPDGPDWDSDTSTDVTGVMVISGEAAKVMNAQLKNARLFRGDPNLENMHPQYITRGACPARIGKHVICRQIPAFTNDGQALKRDRNGKVIYFPQCDIGIKDVTRGIFDEMK